MRPKYTAKRSDAVSVSKVALFDIDGTLVKGLLIVDFPGYLVKQGCFDRASESQISRLARNYKQGFVSYRYISTRIPKLYATGIKGQSQSKILRLARTFIRTSKGRVLPYSKRLVSLLAQHGFLTAAISGSPVEVLLPLKPWGFRRIFGTQMEVKSGIYTGRVRRNLIVAEEKERVVEALTSGRHIDTQGSYAFGDTEQDVPLLNAVGNPIPLNPNRRLRSYATRKGWSISKDVLKELEKRLVRA